ncbi:MAG: hypothetical protein QW318_07165 [Candidatus Caldarchaeum sp.]
MQEAQGRMDIVYNPPPTIRNFMLSDARRRAINGPVGSGKTTGCCFEILRRAAQQAPDAKGRRRTRALVVRNTARQLQDTTIKTWLDWFPEGTFGNYVRTTKTFYLEVGDIQCEVMFRALDDAQDVKNLLSLEVTFAFINEIRDINPDIAQGIQQRIGRYPSAKDGGPTWFGVFADTNPPNLESYWYYVFENIDPDDGITPKDSGWKVFRQPSGLSPLAENKENLPPGYYDTEGKSEEFIRVYFEGEYGRVKQGQPVHPSFSPERHMAKEPIKPIMNGLRSLVVGMDLGLTPAAVIGQMDARGRILVLDEVVAFNMGTQRFVRELLKPKLVERFMGAPIVVVTDPAGMQRAQTDESTAVQIIQNEGLRCIPAPTNSLQARQSVVDKYLTLDLDGVAGLLIDPRCRRLKAALMGGYRYHPRKEAVQKNEHSHIAEALQYLCLSIDTAGANLSDYGKARPIVQVSSLAWT